MKPFSVSEMVLIILCFQHLLLAEPTSAADQEILKLTVQYGNSAYIPCIDITNRSSEQVFTWDIQGNIYTVEFLPPWVQKLSNGLFISSTTLAMSGNYTCYSKMRQGIVYKILTVRLNIRQPNTDAADEPPFLTGKQNSSDEKVLQFVVSEHDVAYIPCLQSNSSNQVLVLVWSIDGAIYPITNLPQKHKKLNGGIIVSGNEIGSRYKCYTTTSDGVLQLIFTITITREQLVAEPDKKMLDSFQVDTTTQASMILVSDLVNLQAEFKTFGFFIESNSARVDNVCEIGKVNYVSRALSINNIKDLIWEDSVQPGPSISIPSFAFDDENSYVYTYAKSDTDAVCANLSYSFRTHSSEITTRQCTQEGFSSCIAIDPQHEFPLTAVWPRYPSSNEDCACPVFKASTSGGPTFQDCYCFRSELTSYNVELNEDNLCWKNLTQDKNNTKVLLISERIDFQHGQHSRVFESQVEIIVQGPDPFPPIITSISEQIVRIKSESTEWSPVLETYVHVLDNTNDTILQTSIPSNNFRFDFGEFPETCAPLRLVAMAHTACTQSSPTFKIYQGTTNQSGNQCDCLHSKVSITMQLLRDDSRSILAILNIMCFEPDMVQYLPISNLYLKTTEVRATDCVSDGANVYCDDYNKFTPFQLNCNTSEIEVRATNLTEDVTYNVTILWISQTDSQTECQLLDSQTLSSSKSLILETSLIITAASLPLFIATLVVIMCILVFYKKSRSASQSLQLNSLLQ